MDKWQKLYNKALEQRTESNKTLNKAVCSLMKEKGFDKDKAELFCIKFTDDSGSNIITFCDEGEYACLDIRTAAKMSKNEIINTIRKYLAPELHDIFVSGEDVDYF